MKKNQVLVLLGILGSVFVLPAITNAIWEFASRPFLLFFWSTLYKLFSLNFESFQNQLFIEIAKNHHEAIQIQTYNLVALIIIFGSIYVLIMVWSVFFQTNDGLKKINEYQKDLENYDEDGCNNCSSRICEIATPISSTKARLNELQTDLPHLKKKALTLSLLQSFLALFFIWNLSLNFVKATLINLYITRYNQYVTIIRPYITDSEFLKIDSSFALIKNEWDYKHILINLKKIAKENNITEEMLP